MGRGGGDREGPARQDKGPGDHRDPAPVQSEGAKADTMNTTDADLKAQLSEAIDQWHQDQLMAGQAVPDFWDECDASKYLAEYLVQLGWRK